MTLKMFRAIWFLSMLAVLFCLLYVYASLPAEVVVGEDGEKNMVLDKEMLFYSTMVLIALVNVPVYLFSKRLTPDEHFRIWLNGLVIASNFFFIIAMSFVSLYNSAEKFNFDQIGFIIYSSVGIVALWLIGWPVYKLVRKFIFKETV
jgi:hypothetical protein